MTDIDINAIRQREQAATDGPWRAVEHGRDITDEAWSRVTVQTEAGIEVAETLSDDDDILGDSDPRSEDAEFIAHARQDIPDLLAKVDELTAELTAVAAAIAPTVTITPASDAARFLHNLYQDWVKTAHERLEQIDELTAYNRAVKGANDDLRAELAETREHLALDRQAVATLRQREQEAREQLTAANRRADGLEADLRSAVTANTNYANENARLRQDRDTQADIAKNRADVITDLTEVIERVEQRANANAVEWGETGFHNGPDTTGYVAQPKAEAAR